MGSPETKTFTTTRGVKTISEPAPGVPFFTPAQIPPAGSATVSSHDSSAPGPDANVPTLYTPLKIRGMTLQNRFVVAPMCMYSADDGHLTDFHLVHLGQFALRGAALTIVEATAVTPNGRISPEDSGLWQDSQIAPLKRIVDFVHSQGQKIGIQLAHAGRKASARAPWLERGPRGEHEIVDAAGGGWPDNVWAPSAIPFAEHWTTPLAMTKEDIQDYITSFVSATKRALAAGVDTIEIHGAHGYLLTEFMSPITNRRTDEYGGSFENRVRLVLDVARAVRAVIPEDMPLFLRISGSEWMQGVAEESWTVDDSIRLAKLLPSVGIDVLDVSSSGNNDKPNVDFSNEYLQCDLATTIRKAVREAGIPPETLRIGYPGFINSATRAYEAVQVGGITKEQGGSGRAPEMDLAFVGRHFLREPEFVLRAAHELNVSVQWPNQYHRVHFARQEK